VNDKKQPPAAEPPAPAKPRATAKPPTTNAPGSERFSQWTQGALNVVIALSLVFGGLWTLHEWSSLRRREVAALEFERLRDLRPTLEARLSVSLQRVAPAPAPDGQQVGGRSFLHIVLEVANDSALNTGFFMRDPPVSVKEVFQPYNAIVVLNAAQYMFANDPISLVTLRGNDSQSFQFIAEVERPGLYLIQFNAEVLEDERDFQLGSAANDEFLRRLRERAPGEPTIEPPILAADSYFFVESVSHYADPGTGRG
jgi:hypothetical protein